MLNAVIANGDLETLKELFIIYNEINDEKEILKISAKLLYRCIRLSKDDLIDILDRCYEIVEKYRDDFRELSDKIIELEQSGNIKDSYFIKEYRKRLSASVSEQIHRFVKELKKSLNILNEENRDFVLLLSLNICDYMRYLCELAIYEKERNELIAETEEAYSKHFRLLEDCYVGIVNPANLTAHFHYAIFVYEILGEKIRAIKMLRQKHQDIINNLDNINEKYKSDYYIFERMSDTITLWVLNSNYLEEESPNI